MIPFRFEKFLEDLLFLVESGEIPVSRIDDAVERILRVKFISGIFDQPFSDPSLLDVIGCKVKRMSRIYDYHYCCQFFSFLFFSDYLTLVDITH
jgi:hypothetical protein